MSTTPLREDQGSTSAPTSGGLQAHVVPVPETLKSSSGLHGYLHANAVHIHMVDVAGGIKTVPLAHIIVAPRSATL